MRTNVVIDDELLEEAKKLSGAKTKREVIAMALEEFVASRKRKELLNLAGKVKFREDYDYKALREGK